MKRKRVEEHRVWLSYVEKREILQKSKGRCAHCGKKIEVGKDATFSLDHVIPLSKGGTNDITNLVGLCDECNKNKGDEIVDIDSWYKFIQPKEGKSLKECFETYCKDYEFLSEKSIFSKDTFPIDVVMYPTVSRRSNRGSIKSKKRVNIKKAVYSDLDEIYNMLVSYVLKIEDEEDSPELRQDLKECVSYWYQHGAIYFSRSSSGNVNMIIPAKINSLSSKEVSDEDKVFKYYYVVGPIYISPVVTLNTPQSFSYFISLISRFLDTVSTCINFPAMLEVDVVTPNVHHDARLYTLLESLFCGNDIDKKSAFRRDMFRGFLPLIMSNALAVDCLKDNCSNYQYEDIQLINVKEVYDSEPAFRKIVDDTLSYLKKCVDVTNEQASSRQSGI